MRSVCLALLALSFFSLSLASFLKDWEKVASADQDEQISFWVALKQRNLDKLE